MRHFACVLLMVVAAAVPRAEAQQRLYAGVSTAADAGTRGNIPGGAVPSVGGVFGVRLSEAWGIELELERGFRTTTAGSGEAILVSFPPTTNPTRQEIEDYGIRTRDERTQTAGAGWAAHAVWRSRTAGRVNAILLAGVSSRVYTTRLVRTTTFVSPLVPPGYRVPDENSSRRMAGSGLDAGLGIIVGLTRQLSVAPEVRVTTGMITNDRYTVARAGVRMMWGF